MKRTHNHSYPTAKAIEHNGVHYTMGLVSLRRFKDAAGTVFGGYRAIAAHPNHEHAAALAAAIIARHAPGARLRIV